jgi:outer membrane protein
MSRMVDARPPVRRAFTAAVVLGALIASGAAPRAQAAEPEPLRLEDALGVAEERSPEYLVLRAHAEAQDLRRAATARTTWPRLSFVSDLSRTDGPARVFAEKLNRGAFGADDFALPRLNDPDAIGHLGTALALELPVDLAGTTRARVRGEEAGTRALEAQVAEARQDLRLRVTEAYARATLAEAALVATRHALESARSREETLEARVSEGAALRAELLRARTRRRQREADVARGHGDEQASLVSLARVLGTDGVQYRPAAPVAAATDDDTTLDAWRTRAQTGRALTTIAMERRTAAEWARRGEQRATLPTLAGYASAFDDRWSGASRRSYAVGATVRWTFDPSQRRRIAAAKADERAAGFERRAAVADVESEVETAWVRRSAAREALQAASGGAEEGREALRVVRERRAAGLATLTDELETEAASLAAELEELRTRTELALADAALRRAAGAL